MHHRGGIAGASIPSGLATLVSTCVGSPTGCKPMQDIEDKPLTYSIMARLALAAAEEHVGMHAKDAGIVAAYAKVSTKICTSNYICLRCPPGRC